MLLAKLVLFKTTINKPEKNTKCTAIGEIIVEIIKSVMSAQSTNLKCVALSSFFSF